MYLASIWSVRAGMFPRRLSLNKIVSNWPTSLATTTKIKIIILLLDWNYWRIFVKTTCTHVLSSKGQVESEWKHLNGPSGRAVWQSYWKQIIAHCQRCYAKFRIFHECMILPNKALQCACVRIFLCNCRILYLNLP